MRHDLRMRHIRLWVDGAPGEWVPDCSYFRALASAIAETAGGWVETGWMDSTPLSPYLDALVNVVNGSEIRPVSSSSDCEITATTDSTWTDQHLPDAPRTAAFGRFFAFCGSLSRAAAVPAHQPVHGGGRRPYMPNLKMTSRFRNYPKGEKRECQTPQPTPTG